MIRRRDVACAFLALLGLACLPGSAFAQGAALDEQLLAAFPDGAELRSSLFSKLLGAPQAVALQNGEILGQTPSGPVLARAVKRSDDFLVEFRREAGAEGTLRGSCVVQRSNAKGNYILQARVFLADDPTCFLRLYPNAKSGGTQADVVMYGALLKQGMAVEGLLYHALVRPLPQIAQASRRSFDWSLVFPSLAGLPTVPEGRALELAVLLESAASFEAFLETPEAAGAVELADPAVPPLGLSALREELPLKQPFAAYPRYQAGMGIPAEALESSIYLACVASLGAAPAAAFAVFGDAFRVLALPRREPDGSLRLEYRERGRALAAGELAAIPKGLYRVARLP